MKRKLAIIISSLIVIALIVGILWFLTRRAAERKGVPPPSFKDFFSASTLIRQQQTPGGELTTDFTTNPNTPGQGTTGTGSGSTGSGGTTGGTPENNVSIFTNTTLNPSGNGTSGGSIGSGSSGTGGTTGSGSGSTGSGGTTGGGTGTTGSGGSGTTGGGTGTGGSGTGPIGTGGPGNTTPVRMCKDEDLNITFTNEDLARLNILQQRFSTIASYLHTDSDIMIVRANYDSYKVKDAQLKELVQYCEQHAPRITEQRYKTHVPTPFWHENGTDLENHLLFTDINKVGLDTLFTEQLLRINLW